jgi:hypothetical protein
VIVDLLGDTVTVIVVAIERFEATCDCLAEALLPSCFSNYAGQI